MLASETPALDIIGARAVRELKPGELAILDADGVHVEQAVPPRHGGEALCIFEHIYFARPDARMSGESLHAEPASAWASGSRPSRRSPPMS